MRLKLFRIIQKNFSPLIAKIHPEIRLLIARAIPSQGAKTLFDPNSLRHFSHMNSSAFYKSVQFSSKTKLLVDINDIIGFRGALNGKWDNTCLNVVQKMGRENSIFIDIGGNVGTTCIPIGALGVPIVVFEPNKELAGILLQNASANNLTRIDVLNVALSDLKNANTYMMLNSPIGNTGASSLLANWSLSKSNNKKTECYVSTLDKSLKFLNLHIGNKLLIIKIDVEGFEREVLNGSKETINRNRPIVIFENNLKLAEDSQFSMKYFNKIFQKYDFFEIDENLNLSDFEPTRTCNAIAIPNNLTKKLRC